MGVYTATKAVYIATIGVYIATMAVYIVTIGVYISTMEKYMVTFVKYLATLGVFDENMRVLEGKAELSFLKKTKHGDTENMEEHGE